MPRISRFTDAARTACVVTVLGFSSTVHAQTPPAAAFVQQVRTGHAVQTGDGNQLTQTGYQFMSNLAVVPGHGCGSEREKAKRNRGRLRTL